MTFDQAMQLTSGISGAAAFEDLECAGLWEYLDQVPADGRVVEIGAQYGRSSSLILQAARARHLIPTFIDPWEGNVDTMLAWMRMAHSLNVPLTVHMMPTEEARANGVWRGIDLLLIDGDHSEAGVTTDLMCMAPLVRSGGHLCAHDYSADSLPEVTAAVDRFMMRNEGSWARAGLYGTLGVWRRR